MELRVITEQWKPIIMNGITFNYLISNFGNVWSPRSNMFLKQSLSSGYNHVTLRNDRNISKFSIHRLVATMFIDNPNSLEYVNHKNGNKLDNRVENLEWLSPSENKRHGSNVLKANGPKVGVDQYSLDGSTFIAHYDSIAEASRQTWTSNTGITSVCRGKYKSSGGFIWRYSDVSRTLEDTEPEGLRHPDHPDYIITNNGKIYNTSTRKYLALHNDRNGYTCVSLCTNGRKQNFVVHVLVAKFYVYNPDPINKIYVNHINNVRDDNDYRNLEWVSQSENIDHAYKYGGLAKKQRAVIQYDLLNNEINRFISINEASRMINGDSSGIHQVCNGLMGHYYGFRWKYANVIGNNISLSLNIISAPP